MARVITSTEIRFLKRKDPEFIRSVNIRTTKTLNTIRKSIEDRKIIEKELYKFLFFCILV